MDDIDLSILSILEKDARTPFTKIAEKLKVSDATIHIRVRKMEKSGVIKKYTIVLDEEKIEKAIITFVLIRIEPGTVEEVCSRLVQLEEVYEIYEVHERYDVLVKIRSHSLEEFRSILIQKIRSIPNIVGSETYTVYKTWKQDLGVRVDNNQA